MFHRLGTPLRRWVLPSIVPTTEHLLPATRRAQSEQLANCALYPAASGSVDIFAPQRGASRSAGSASAHADAQACSGATGTAACAPAAHISSNVPRTTVYASQTTLLRVSQCPTAGAALLQVRRLADASCSVACGLRALCTESSPAAAVADAAEQTAAASRQQRSDGVESTPGDATPTPAASTASQPTPPEPAAPTLPSWVCAVPWPPPSPELQRIIGCRSVAALEAALKELGDGWQPHAISTALRKLDRVLQVRVCHRRRGS